MTPARIPLPPLDQVAQQLRDGATLTALADQYGCTIGTISQRLSHAGYDDLFTHHNCPPQPPRAAWPLVIPTWMEHALCATVDPEIFFPEKGGSVRKAKATCLRCEVRAECLEYALDHGERFGLWGGLSERERRKIAERRLA